MNTPKAILKKINERKEVNSFRSLRLRTDGIDFFSNDYLGMAREDFHSSLSDGATGSALISGYTTTSENLESFAATFFNQKAATLFNSGYAANLGFFSCVPQRGDTVLYDALCHASIRDGIQMGLAKAYNFKHNDLVHLEARLQKAEGEIYVSIESVYSMDGDTAPLKEIALLCEKYQAFLIVDEAHSAGVNGVGGNGSVSELELDELIFAKLITFGKAYGSHGALILGSKDLKDYLVNFSRPLIYTTALPPSSQERLQFVLEKTSEEEHRREALQENITWFKQCALSNGVDVLKSHAAIQGIVIPGNLAVKQKAEELQKAGFLVKAILSPTVPKGEERLRICLHSYNTKSEITALIDLLK